MNGKRIWLSGTEWVHDAPAGNRLRWSYPVRSLTGGGKFLGLPQVLIVERAEVDVGRRLQFGTGPSSSIPYFWWDSMGTVTINGIFPPVTYKLLSAVQAARFRYRGDTTRMRAFSSETGDVAADRTVSDGDLVVLEAPLIDTIEFYVF